MPICELAEFTAIWRLASATVVPSPPPAASAIWLRYDVRNCDHAGCFGAHDVCNEKPRRHGAQVVKFCHVLDRCFAEEDDGHALVDTTVRFQMSFEVEDSGA